MKTLDDLPELPFEKVLSYLSLEERLKLGAVSRSCHQKIANYRVRSLCYSERPSGFIYGKSRWVNGAFAKNFISFNFIRFESFCNAYHPSVFSNLRHLRLCDLSFDPEYREAFTRTLNSFSQLEELDIIRAKCTQERTFTLKLPMLTSVRLEYLVGFKSLTLDAPRLRMARLVNCSGPFFPVLKLVHGESVEKLIVYDLAHLTANTRKKLTNLKSLYICYLRKMDPTFLSSLKQLKEVQLFYPYYIEQVFQQKQRYGRADLKIYLSGLLLNGPNDPALSLTFSEIFHRLAEDPSRLSDVIPFWNNLSYSTFERVTLEPSTIDVLNRLNDLSEFSVNRSVQDIQRFLDLLKNCENVVELEFWGDQLPELFVRLPDHCAVQKLKIHKPPSDPSILSGLKNLIYLNLPNWRFDAEFIRKFFEELELEFFSCFEFSYIYHYTRRCTIEIEIHPKRFRVWVEARGEAIVSDLNAAIQFITNPETFMN